MTGSPSTPTPPAGPAADRAARLEALLGDPREPRNPHGRAALLRADEAGELPAATEPLLVAVSLAAELVPRALGGRLGGLDGLDGLAAVLRPLGRRHFRLGWTRGAAPFAAAAAVWADGTEGQRTATAHLLLGGGRIATLARGPATGAAAARDGLRARPAGGGFVLSGYGTAVPEADRARALLAYARTGGSAGPRSHSALLLDVRGLPAGRLRRGPRSAAPYGSFARVGLDACPVPRSRLVGEEGAGVPLEVRTAQVSRCLLPAVAVGAVDSVLRDAVDVSYAEDRPVRRGGRRHRVLAGVFTDLLTGDCLVQAGLRTLTCAPESASAVAAAAQYVAAALCRDVLDDLAGALGARVYEPAPAGEAFRRTARDLAAAGLGPAGQRGSLGTLVAHLRLLAAGVPGIEPHSGIFHPGPSGAPFDAARLVPAARADVLTAALLHAAAGTPAARGGAAAALARLTGLFADEVRAMGRRCAALPGVGTTAPALPEALVLADRYAWVLAAAACVAVRREHEGRSWLGEPAWALLALGRIGRRLALDVPPPGARTVDAVVAELLGRHRRFRSFDLYGVRLAGGGAAYGRR
ncbi:acyl-CoA dehydrogenase [Streptomyces sp. NPDC004134]|uniref:acyl-CoA dehydrogenase n=1 Tax=Streptomyces sp. NPDC004134 TaxID=3364691 RepID=UPI00368116D1